jgi:hypothetical protein
LRHICADVLLDPTSNVLRRSAGFYQSPQSFRQKTARQKRQSWMNNPANQTNVSNRQGIPAPNLGPGYYQNQQQVYGGYPAAPTQVGSNNQLYNPNPNLNNMGNPNQPILNTPWNNTMNLPYNRQMNNGGQNFNPNAGGYLGAATYTRGPQSCLAMSGERITVQSLAGTQPEGMKINY